MRRRLYSALMTVGIAVLASGLAAEDWPQWRGPDRTGISEESGWLVNWPTAGPAVLWKKDVGIGCSSLSTLDGRLYTMGNVNPTAGDGRRRDDPNDKDVVWCLDAETGEEIWKYEYPMNLQPQSYEGGPGATPTLDGERVYTISKDGLVLALDADTGEKVWSREAKKDWGGERLNWGFNTSPLVHGERLILSAGPMVALNRKTGELIWKSPDLGSGYSSPFLFQLEGEDPWVAHFNTYGIQVVRASDGNEVLRFNWETNPNVNATTPIVHGTKIFISADYNHGCALVDIKGGEPTLVYENRNMRNHINSCVFFEGKLYGFDQGRLKCIDWMTGEEHWTDNSFGKGSLIIADGKLIILGEKGDVAVAEPSPDAYKEISRAHVLDGRCWVLPVLSNGLLYCRNNNGNIVCLDLRKKQG